MMKELKPLVIPEKLRHMLTVSLKNTTAKISFRKTISKEIKVNKGVKQSDSISPTIFHLILEAIIRRTNFININIITDQLQVIAYADDLVIIAKMKMTLIRAIEKLDKEAKKLELEINRHKTKYMTMGKDNTTTQKYLIPQNHKFETVSTFSYLEVIIGKIGKEKTKERILKSKNLQNE
ncbi:uncharacterized protein [Diabrotica undecimpunctata]|uniref:uncharacterized protein n=1 Tax=Diabrotica undecimpunctata TaxID=50387 RepID=UPI003B636E81